MVGRKTTLGAATLGAPLLYIKYRLINYLHLFESFRKPPGFTLTDLFQKDRFLKFSNKNFTLNFQNPNIMGRAKTPLKK